MRPNIFSINQTVGGVERPALFHQGMLTLVEFTPQLELTCEAYGTPPPDVVWLNNGIALQNIPGRRTITVENGGSFGEQGTITRSILSLSEVQLSDAGEYTCRAISGNVSPIPGTTAWTFMFVVTGEIDPGCYDLMYFKQAVLVWLLPTLPNVFVLLFCVISFRTE